MSQNNPLSARVQVAPAYAAALGDSVFQFLRPLLHDLDACLDRRLVVTLLGTVLALLTHRHRNYGLLLSELGGYLDGPAHAPAGTKRLSRLLHSARWTAAQLEAFLWQQAQVRVQALTDAQETPLLVWDESVLEKSESLKLEGLGPVRSTKAVRLQRIKPGYFHPPGGRPVFVPGFHELALLVLGQHGPPTLAAMRWWTTRGERAQTERQVEGEILAQAWRTWGRGVLHVWDRGFAGSPWLQSAFVYQLRFVLRWPKHYQLRNAHAHPYKAWEITRGKRSWDHRLLWDARRRCDRKVGVMAVPVYEVTRDHPLWLVVARSGGGREPWYLLTSEQVTTAEEAWRVVLAYARRWQIEMTLRYDKSELGVESIRVQQWEPCHKLLLLTALAYSFLLSLLAPLFEHFCAWLLATWCHRTGKWSREVPAPLYRLRSALARLWSAHPPPALARLNLG